MSSSRSLLLLLLVSVSGCPSTHDGGDTGEPAADAPTDGTVIRGCFYLPAAAEGAPCDFDEPCVVSWDFYMGYCGDERWLCVDGRIDYVDNRFGCSLPDAGAPDTGLRAYCDHYTPPPAATTTDCRSDSDCPSGTCWRPGDTAPHDVSGACSHECTDDASCGEGSVCETYNAGVCARCQPSCTPSSCRLYETCGDDGHCMPARCETADYTCPPGSDCVSVGEVDEHGCLDVPCVTDADCGCGACVAGTCAAGPGRCELPRP